MRAIQKIAATLVLMLLAITECAIAQDWRWYPRKPSADSGALRPDLEGTKADPQQSGLDEVEEMRQWLQRRDEERRQQGVIVPDTVEQLSAEDLANIGIPRRSGRLVQGADAAANPDRLQDNSLDDEASGRVRGIHYPKSPRYHKKRYSRHRRR